MVRDWVAASGGLEFLPLSQRLLQSPVGGRVRFVGRLMARAKVRDCSTRNDSSSLFFSCRAIDLSQRMGRELSRQATKTLIALLGNGWCGCGVQPPTPTSALHGVKCARLHTVSLYLQPTTQLAVDGRPSTPNKLDSRTPKGSARNKLRSVRDRWYQRLANQIID